MKLVKIKINNRVERILNFDETTQLHNNTFIIRDYINGKAELFRIKKDATLITDDGTLPLTIKNINSNGNVLDVQLSSVVDIPESNSSHSLLKRNKSNDTNQKNSIKGLSEKDGSMVYELTKPKNDDHYELKFHLIDPSQNQDENDNIEFNPISVFIYYATTSETFDAIVDFGSEASQACWSKSDSTKINFINLTESIRLQHDNPIRSKKNSEFIQYESDSLYKSIYYIKKSLSSSNIKVWPNYDGKTWKFLSGMTEADAKELNEYLQVPNSKIFNFDISRYTRLDIEVDSILHHLDDIGDDDDVVGRILLNNIVLQVLRAIQIASKKNNAYIVLNILMPNVYPIHVTSKKLNWLAEDIISWLHDFKPLEGTINSRPNNDATIQEEETQFNFQNIRAMELRAISESDASLLGYINTISNSKSSIASGNYLIMDAGKGTLDFSIMKADRNGVVPYINLSRSGIIGAGNAITYGILVGLVNDYLCTTLTGYVHYDQEKKQESIRAFIFNKILNETDPAKKTKLFESIEQYKKLYNQIYKFDSNVIVKTDENKTQSSITALDIDKFKQWILDTTNKNVNLTKEGKEYVTIEIENIVNEVAQKLIDIIDYNKTAHNNLFPLEGVIFTGRGFLMKELQEKMKEMLIHLKFETKEGYKSKSHSIIKNQDSITTHTGSDSNMKDICLRIRQLLNTDKYNASPSRQTVGLLHNIRECDDDTQTSVVPKTNLGEKDPERISKNNVILGIRSNSDGQQLQDIGKATGNIENEGIVIEGITNDSRISIGGWLYSINSAFKGKTGILLFDGMRYWLTAKDTRSQPLGDSNQGDPDASYLCYESLFPNISLDNENMIIIPTRIDQSNSAFRKVNASTETETESNDTPSQNLDPHDESQIGGDTPNNSLDGRVSNKSSDDGDLYGIAAIRVAIKRFLHNLFSK